MPRLLASKYRLSRQHSLLLLAILLLISGTSVVVVLSAEVQTNDCEVGTDGSCLDWENSNAMGTGTTNGTGTGTGTGMSSSGPDPDEIIKNDDDDNCVDGNEKCKEWADSGKIC